jgi:chromosome segregation ATPase
MRISELESKLSTLNFEKQSLQDSLRAATDRANSDLAASERQWSSRLQDASDSSYKRIFELESTISNLRSSLEEVSKHTPKADPTLEEMLSDPALQSHIANLTNSIREKLESELSTMRQKCSTLEAKNASLSEDIESHTEAVRAMNSALSDSKAAHDILAAKCEELTLKLEAAEANSGSNDSLSKEAVSGLMQDVYTRMHDMFTGEDGEIDDSVSYTAQDLLKRVRKCLKQIAQER